MKVGRGRWKLLQNLSVQQSYTNNYLLITEFSMVVELHLMNNAKM